MSTKSKVKLQSGAKPRKGKDAATTAAAAGPDLVEVLTRHGRKVPGDELAPWLRGEVVKRHAAEAAAEAAAEDTADMIAAWDERPSAAAPPPPVQPNWVPPIQPDPWDPLPFPEADRRLLPSSGAISRLPTLL